MKLSKYQKQKIDKQRKKTRMLYKQGLTLREVSNIVGYSHEWVRKVINTPPIDKV